MNHYERYDWDALPQHARDALADLGWVEYSWKRGSQIVVSSLLTPASENSNWREFQLERIPTGENWLILNGMLQFSCVGLEIYGITTHCLGSRYYCQMINLIKHNKSENIIYVMYVHFS